MLALLFHVGPNRVAVDVRRVREVVPRVTLTPTPDGRHGAAGVFVYRGAVVPVIDLHRLGGGECPEHLSSRIILIPGGDGSLVGLLATQVAEVRDVAAPSSPGGGLLGDPVADGAGVLRVLDPDRLFAQLAGANS